MKNQTSRRGIAITSAAAVAAVIAAVGATAAMNAGEGAVSPRTSVEQSASQGDGFGGNGAAGDGTDGNGTDGNGTDGNGAPGSATPTFLSAADMPATPEAGTWQEGAVTAGLPDPEYTCIKGVLPAEGTSYKSFTGDMTAEARQFITVLKDMAGAELVAKEAAQSIERCAEALPDDNVVWKKYGSYTDVADGLAVYGLYFAPEGSEYHLQLIGVGRDGSNVVVTTLGQGGQESEAPVESFTTTARAALDQAF